MFAKLGVKPRQQLAADDCPPFPWPIGYLWDDFCDFAAGLVSNGMCRLAS